MDYLLKVYVWISLTRIVNVIIVFFSVIVAVIISSDVSSIGWSVIAAAACAALTAAAGNVINDVWDYKSDLVNKPGRPIPSGKITKREALVFYLFLVLISLVIASAFNPFIFSIIILSHMLLLLYTLRLKKIILVGNFVISFLTGFVFIYGGIIAGNTGAAVIPALFAMLINLPREGIKAIEDIPGDKSTGTITFPEKYGVGFSKKLISVLLLLLLLFTIVPFVNGYYKIEYFIIVMVLVNPLIVYVIKSLLQSSPRAGLNKLSFILKLDMIFGLTAIYFGR
jgi:geranylgeranylglycerol-phosphate geranylgeranyltransferase